MRIEREIEESDGRAGLGALRCQYEGQVGVVEDGGGGRQEEDEQRRTNGLRERARCSMGESTRVGLVGEEERRG